MFFLLIAIDSCVAKCCCNLRKFLAKRFGFVIVEVPAVHSEYMSYSLAILHSSTITGPQATDLH